MSQVTEHRMSTREHQRVAHTTHCNTLQHTANTLQQTATHCNEHQGAPNRSQSVNAVDALAQIQAAADRVLEATARKHSQVLVLCVYVVEMLCTLHYIFIYTATHCNTLQHTATHCNCLEALSGARVVCLCCRVVVHFT